MSRFDCEEGSEPVTAPRVGCHCRECYRAREAFLDRRLVEVFQEAMNGPSVSPGGEIVHRAVQAYLAGRIEWAALHIEVIKALVKHSDEQFKRSLDLVARQPFFIVDPKHGMDPQP